MSRVLHVVGTSSFGGGALVVSSIARGALAYGHEVTVLAGDPILQGHLQSLGIHTLHDKIVVRDISPSRDARDVMRLTRLIKTGGFDIVHTHTTKGGLIGRIAARLAKVPAVVHTVHGFAFHETTSRPIVRGVAALERTASRWSNRLVTVSNFHRSWAIDLGIASPDRIAVIPNGISDERITPRSDRSLVRRTLGLTDGHFHLLCHGRLAPGKGLKELLDAMLLLPESVSLTLVGEGALQAQIDGQISRLALGGRVRSLGFRSDIGDLLHASDAVVLPSHREGLSISLLEAMASGKPIVATAIGSNLEVLEGGLHGLLSPVGRAWPLADSVVRLMSSRPLREHLALSARRRFIEAYQESRMIDDYLNLYELMISQERPRSRRL